MEIKNANGAEGFLIKDAANKKWYLRIYKTDDKEQFIYYELRHCDLHVKIDEN